MATSNTNDFTKKKRGNRSAKLKQCKLDARREQWLSQVKNKDVSKKEVIGCDENERAMPIETRSVEEINGDDRSSIHRCSDSESSPSNSLTSHRSSLLSSNDSEATFTASSRSVSDRSISSICNSCFLSSISDDEEEDDHVHDHDLDHDDVNGCLDDWETMADALAVDEENQQKLNSTNSKSGLTNVQLCGNDISSRKQEIQVWRPKDVYRPQRLPGLSKECNSKLNLQRKFGRGGSIWARRNIRPVVPTSCPICCEDLDSTDSSFLPCLCGFQLCLFCHKRICEEDARCPGCRKEYDCDKVGISIGSFV